MVNPPPLGITYASHTLTQEFYHVGQFNQLPDWNFLDTYLVAICHILCSYLLHSTCLLFLYHALRDDRIKILNQYQDEEP